MAGGTVYPLEVLREICDGAHDAGLKVHMDGARIFNAATALGMPVMQIAAHADTVMFCLSKGLGAPVGSMLAGPAGADRQRPALSQAARRRHAPGRRAGGRRTGRARETPAELARIMPTRARSPRGLQQIRDFDLTRTNEYRHFRHRRHRNDGGRAERSVEGSGRPRESHHCASRCGWSHTTM